MPQDVAAPPGDVEKAPSGVAMKVLRPGVGSEHAVDNDCVSVVFRAWRRDGSLFSTSGPHGEATTQCLRTAMPGVAEALKLMVVGERRRVWIPAALAHAPVAHHGEKHLAQAAPENVDLTFDLELIRILKSPPTPSDLTSPAQGAVRMPSGVIMRVLTPGVGTSHPSVNNWVTVDYTGWTSDGKLFETTIMSGHPAVVLLGRALAGWQDSLPHMVVGEKVRLWIPAALAFGEKPDSRFLPAGNLVYDLELLAFK